ncbi:hypothetical protein IJ425_06470 [bacterium]|nr:hypothetical protein [bacterium]
MAMDPVNNVRIGGYTVGNQPNASARNNEKTNENANAKAGVQNNQKDFNVDNMFNAMNISAMQNMLNINKAEAKAINPADFLSEERISDIEAMMAEFEAGVSLAADAIETEFPGMFAAEQKNALAAKIFSSLG